MTEKEKYAQNIIELERLRAELQNILMSKGMATQENETLSSLIEKVRKLVPGDDYFKNFIEDGISEIINDEITTLKPYAFYYSDTLEKAILPNAIMIGSGAFMYCNILKFAYFQEAKQLQKCAFSNCANLRMAYFPKTVSADGQCFNVCGLMTHVIMPLCESVGSYVVGSANLKVIDSKVMPSSGDISHSPLLETVIIRQNRLQGLGSANHITSEETKFYVPQELVEQYKVATNWVALPDVENRILPIEGSMYEDTAWFEQTDEYREMIQELGL